MDTEMDLSSFLFHSVKEEEEERERADEGPEIVDLETGQNQQKKRKRTQVSLSYRLWYRKCLDFVLCTG